MPPFDRSILHLDLDAFFVAVECLRNDNLRGKPLLIGSSSNRGEWHRAATKRGR